MRRSSITGVRELERKLERKKRNVGRLAQERALLAGAEVIAETARRHVHVRSGRLRDSIMVSKGSAHFGPWGMSGTVGLAGLPFSAGGATVHIGPAAPDGFYGHMEEFGTVDTPAHPFMRPAFDLAQWAALDVIAGSLSTDLARS